MPAVASVRHALLILLAAAPCAAAQQRTYANPIDIDYRFNFEQKDQGISFRSGADPVIVVQGGKYYLFETIGDGYWESSDLGTWRHITPTRWPLLDVVAPAVLSVRDTIYLLPSTTSPLPILMLTEPASGRVEFYNRLLPWLPNHLATGARRGGLQCALGHRTGEVVSDLPALCRSGDDPRVAGADGRPGVLGRDRSFDENGV